MHIRTATPADAPLLARLAADTMREAFGPPHNPAELVEEYVASAFTTDRLTAELGDPRAHTVLLEQAPGQAVGYAKLRQHAPPRRMAERRAVELERIYLLRAYIGQGLGNRLMDYCLQYARTVGYRGKPARAVWLGVWEHNHPARAFYARWGFRPFGWHYFQFGSDRQRDLWLQKVL